MSVKIISNVWDESTAEGSALLVMLALADHANDDGVSWPGLERLAERARLDVRQTQRIIGQLVETGELYVLRKHGRGHTNVYLVTLGHNERTLLRVLSQRFEMAPDEARRLTYDILKKRAGEKVTPETPIQGEKVTSGAEKVTSEAEKVTSEAVKGDIHTTRTVINRQLTVTEPEYNARARDDASGEDQPWDVALNQLRLTLPRDTYHAWLRDTRLFRPAADRWVVECPTAQHVEFLTRRLNGKVANALADAVGGGPVRIEYTVRPPPPPTEVA